MKLQLNNSGSWKTVCDFFVEHLELAKEAGGAIGMLDAHGGGGGRLTLRIIDAREKVIWRWDYQRLWYRAAPADYEVLP